MAKSLATIELNRLAELGARARLSELERERASLLQLFPSLRRSVIQGLHVEAVEVSGTPGRRRRRRSHMSAEARRAVSARMKAYWANRRAAKAKAKRTR